MKTKAEKDSMGTKIFFKKNRMKQVDKLGSKPVESSWSKENKCEKISRKLPRF